MDVVPNLIFAVALMSDRSREMTERQPGEKTCDYLGRFAGQLAETAMTARERGDTVHAIFFATKAAETLALARALGFGRATLTQEPKP